MYFLLCPKCNIYVSKSRFLSVLFVRRTQEEAAREERRRRKEEERDDVIDLDKDEL